jgi:asparagine N-glycosylation enzyme membrane subunit Stt3
MDAMQGRRAMCVLGLAAAAAIGLGLRLHTWTQAREGGRVRPLDSDSAYHLRRARFAAAHFPRTILFDPLMNFPSGGMAIWPPLFDLALAAPARLAHGAGAPADDIERGAAWVPVALGAGAIALLGWIGWRLYGPAAGAAAGLFLAVCPGHILWTQYAHTDQHAAESFCGLLALGLFLRSRERPGATGNASREAAAGLALTLAVLSWQGGIYWGAIFALSLVCESLRTGRPVLRGALLTLGIPAALAGAATALWLGPLRPPITYVSFGFFQPLFLAGLLGGTVAASLVLRAATGRLAVRELIPGAAVVLVAAAATAPFAGEVAAGLVNGLGYVARTTHEVAGSGGYVSYPKGWLHGIFEARPLLADGPVLALRQLSPAFFLAPLAVLAWAARALRGVSPGVNLTLAVWGAVTIFLSLSQRLNVYYAAPLAALACVEAARAVATRLRRRRTAARRPPRAWLAGAAGLLLALPMAPGLRDELSTVYVPGSDLLQTLERMRTTLPRAIDPYDPRLLGPPPFPPALSRASSVLAPWSLGHLILYDAEQPVVANNFGYGFLDAIRFFLAETEDEALAIAHRRRARWILATDLVPRMNDYASYLGRPPYLASTPNGPAPSRAYFATMQSRLYDFDGRGADLPGLTLPPLNGVRLLFHSQSAIRRGGRWIPLWKVFEIVE